MVKATVRGLVGVAVPVAAPDVVTNRAAAPHDKPNVLQYIGYCYGRRLPTSMRQWVADDLAGPGRHGPHDGAGRSSRRC